MSGALWMGWSYLFAALVVGGGVGAARFIAEGRRRVLEQRRNPLRALERVIERSAR